MLFGGHERVIPTRFGRIFPEAILLPEQEAFRAMVRENAREIDIVRYGRAIDGVFEDGDGDGEGGGVREVFMGRDASEFELGGLRHRTHVYVGEGVRSE